MLENNELKIAINNLKENQNQENETEFLNLLKDASFYVITETKIEANTIISEMIDNDENFSLLLLNTDEGDGYFPLFTDENELTDTNIPDNSVIIEFNNLLKILRDNELGKGIVINPFNESCIMTKDEIFTIFETKPDDMEVESSVSDSPEDLVATLRNDELKSAIHNMKENPNKETESLFMEEFFKAKFIAPSAPQMDPRMVEELNKQGANISTMPQLLTVKLQDGGVYYPAYTDREELMRSGEDVTVTVVTFAYYLKFFSDKSRIDGILINPYGDGFIMPKKVMNSLYNASKK